LIRLFYPVLAWIFSARSDLIYGSWGGRAKSTSAHFGRGATARESHARFKDSTVYTVPPDELEWLSQRKRKTADGSEGSSEHSDEDREDDNEEAPRERDGDHADVTVPPPPQPASDEPLRMQMSFRDLVEYFQRVWMVFVSKSLNNWWTVYELTRQLQVAYPGVPAHVSSAPHLDPLAQFYPEMLMDLVQVRCPCGPLCFLLSCFREPRIVSGVCEPSCLRFCVRACVQGIVDRLVDSRVLEVSKGLLIPRYRLSSTQSPDERLSSFASLVSSLDAMKPGLLPIVLKSESP
jgi:hypothetical protein